MALFMIANGALLALWPRRFVRFYDFWTRGDRVGRRVFRGANVERIEYRLLGVGLLVFGLLMIRDLVHVASRWVW